MKKILQCALAILALSCFAFQIGNAQPVPAAGGGSLLVFEPPCIAGCPNPVMLSQVNPTGLGSPSQIFSDEPTFSTESSDDFPVAVASTISSIDIQGTAFGPLNLGTAYILNVYQDAAGLPGALVFTESFDPAIFDADGDGVFSLFPTNTTVLSPGTYWFSVQLDCAFGTCGQFFWSASTDDLTGNPWAVRNPSDGFGTGCTDWTPIDVCGNFAGGTGPGLLFGIALCPAAVVPDPTISQTDEDGDGNPDIFDPCACGDPLNIVDGGGVTTHFHDFVLVTSGPGETWQITALNSGVILDAGLAAIPLNTVLPEIAPGVYRLDLFHPVGVGFNVTVDRTAGGGPFPLVTGGTCNACPLLGVPAMGEWGLIILALLLLSFSTVFMMRRQTAVAGVGAVASQSSGIPFDGASFGKMLAYVMLGLAVVFAVAVSVFGYEMTTADVPGSLIAGPVLAYLLHLLFSKK